MADRTRARQLAAEFIAKGDPVGWFEQLYREADEGKGSVPWVDRRPNPSLVTWWASNKFSAAGKTALVVGCGLGDDSEQVAEWGFDTTAFDVAPTAVESCRRRFPETRVRYVAADLLRPPTEWLRKFDFVMEANTLQVLPQELRKPAMRRVADFVAENGRLFVIARARNEEDPRGEMPWPLTRRELNGFQELGLRQILCEEYDDQETPPVRRFRALYLRPCDG